MSYRIRGSRYRRDGRVMPTRRAAVIMIGATALSIALSGEIHGARAMAGEQATIFVKSISDSLVAIANSASSPQEKRPRFQEVLEAAVDIDDTARSCLGSFWQTATTDQQKQYTALFRDLLVTRITNHLGKYQGVRVTVGAARASGDTEIVNTTVDRPRIPISQIDWVVSTATGRPKVVDLLSEGVSMRVTHSSDFTSYLSRHNIDALIETMRKQKEQRR